MMNPTEYGRDVRRRREVAQWSREHLAALAALSAKTVANVEAGRGSNPSTRRLIEQALAQATEAPSALRA